MLATPLRTRAHTEPEKMQRIVREVWMAAGLEQARRKGRTPWPKNYESDHHYALEVVTRECARLGLTAQHASGELGRFDLIIEGDYRGLPGSVAYESKFVDRPFPLLDRLERDLFALSRTEVKSALFSIYDATGQVDWAELETLRERFPALKVRFERFEDLTGKRIPRGTYTRLLETMPDLGRIGFDPFFEPALLNVLYVDLQREQVSLILGAGVSQSAGLPSWTGLIQTLWSQEVRGLRALPSIGEAEALRGVTEVVGDSPLILARTLAVLGGDRLYTRIQSALYKAEIQASATLEGVAHLIETLHRSGYLGGVLSFNYDDLLERALAQRALRVHTQFSEEAAGSDLTVAHLHGYLPPPPSPVTEAHRQSVVFAEDRYHALYEAHYAWVNRKLLGALSDQTCVFVGCSLTDPNLRRLLEQSQRTRPGLRHFVFLPARGVLESRDAESDDLLNRAMYLQEQVLGQLGCSVIWFRTFEELPQLLEGLCEPLPRPLTPA